MKVLIELNSFRLEQLKDLGHGIREEPEEAINRIINQNWNDWMVARERQAATFKEMKND